MADDYAREKYWQALGILVSTSSLQVRLTHAAQVLMRLRDEDISDPELAKRHAAVMKTLLAKPLGDDPRDFSDEQASELSREILSIYIGLRGGI